MTPSRHRESIAGTDCNGGFSGDPLRIGQQYCHIVSELDESQFMTHHDDPAWEPAYARRSERMKASEIRELLKILEKPGIISFAVGIPDPKLFPGQAAAKAYVDALATPKSTGI